MKEEKEIKLQVKYLFFQTTDQKTIERLGSPWRNRDWLVKTDVSLIDIRKKKEEKEEEKE